MPERMSNKTSEYMSNKMPERMSDKMSEYIPNRLSNRMPGFMPERMSECVYILYIYIYMYIHMPNIAKYHSRRYVRNSARIFCQGGDHSK